MPRTVIVGAGLAGLSAAYHLGEGYEILEAEERVGGLCRSEWAGPFLFDYAIHILYSADPYASALIRKLLGENFSEQDRSSWVYSKNVFTRYPFQANTYGLPVDVVKECVMGVIRARYENHHTDRPTTFEEVILRSFGQGIAKHFMLPFNRKCWGIDPSQMSTEWIEGRIPIPDVEEVVEGALTDQKKGFGPNAKFWYPRKGGIGALPEGFLPYLDQGKIRLKTRVGKIRPLEKEAVLGGGGRLAYDRLISTMPLPTLVRMMAPDDAVPPPVRQAVRALQCNTIYGVNFGLSTEASSDKHWVYVPEEDYVLHRVSYPMNFARSMAPAGKSSITVEVSSSRQKHVPREGLEPRIASELVRLGILRSQSEIIETSVLTLSPAYVIYHDTHRRDVDLILGWLEEQKIYSCGRFGCWEYLNMDHSILSGKRAAEKASRA